METVATLALLVLGVPVGLGLFAILFSKALD